MTMRRLPIPTPCLDEITMVWSVDRTLIIFDPLRTQTFQK
jgi:hypothetical protein